MSITCQSREIPDLLRPFNVRNCMHERELTDMQSRGGKKKKKKKNTHLEKRPDTPGLSATSTFS